MKAIFTSNSFKFLLISLLLSNFSAFSQKTTIWFVRSAETTDTTDVNPRAALSSDGQNRAKALLKALKNEHIKAIYFGGDKAAELTINPLAEKVKILPRATSDDIKTLTKKILRNFQGDNVLIVGQYNTLVTLIQAFGGATPFETLTKNDYDFLFSLTLSAGPPELYISYYGKAHHVTNIPQSFIIDKYNPGFTPAITNH